MTVIYAGGLLQWITGKAQDFFTNNPLSEGLANILQGMGIAFASQGTAVLEGSTKIWKLAGEYVIRNAASDPQHFGAGAWAYTSNVYSIFRGIGAALIVFFFLLGWAHEITDVRQDMRLTVVVKFFLRLIFAEAVFDGFWGIVGSMLQYSAVLVAQMGIQMDTTITVSDVVSDAMTEANGGVAALGAGIIILVLSLVGAGAICISAIRVIMAMAKRFFKIYVAAPIGILAVPSIAGGDKYSNTAITWFKAFIGYCLEGVVMVMAVSISTKLFGAGRQIFDISSDGSVHVAVYCLGSILTCVLPMMTCVAFCESADQVIGRLLGL